VYKCDCQDDGKFDARYFDLRPTKVMGDGTCIRCGNYAVWENQETKRADNGEHTEKVVTVFKLDTGESKQFDHLVEASYYLGYKSKYTLANGLKGGKEFFYSKMHKGVAIVGRHTKIPEKVKKAMSPEIIYAFSHETGKMVKKGTMEELVKKLKIKRSIILSNLCRSTIQTKCGHIFSKNSDFDVEAYKNSVETPSSFDNFEINWRQDVISFDQEELGVEVVTDYYGTWKEKLYS